jgi:DNA polymerase
MMKKQFSELIKIINNTEDVVNGGWKTEHEPVTIGEAVPSGAATRPFEGFSSDSLEAIASEIMSCTGCGLSTQRKTPVPGAGVVNPVVLFIGEGPGAEEDKCGIPFVGKAGQYLDKWLDAIDLKRDENCFIGNIIKCRPPGNRDPHPDEIAACRPFLLRQLVLIKPMIIVTLGRFASQVICSSELGIGRLRGSVHEYQGIPVIPTYHPSAVLRNPELRSAVWSDLKKVKELSDEIGQRR